MTIDPRTEEPTPGYFPLGYYVEFLELLASRPDVFRVISYSDLPWGDDFDHAASFPNEFRAWNQQLADGTRNKKLIYVILQHDVDNHPERTEAILREQERLGLVSNVMLFAERINRRHFQKTGELVVTKYEPDLDYLEVLQSKGFEICYHCNAFERGHFDISRAQEVFESDVEQLRKRFRVGYFSPHGGPRSPTGETNNCLPMPASLESDMRWVANRYTLRLGGGYSDGGINSKQRDPNQRDLRDHVSTWKRGRRYRVLTHPQYYGESHRISPRMNEAAWYREMVEAYRGNPRPGCWDEVASRF